MMEFKFKICDGKTEDSCIVEADTIEETQELAKIEAEKRGWKDCWSVQL